MHISDISVKWVGIFGMAVVGLYTVEDLWNKFGEPNIIQVPRSGGVVTLTPANISSSLGCSCSLSDSLSGVGLYVQLLAPLFDSGEFWSWRRTNVFFIPSQLERFRTT